MARITDLAANSSLAAADLLVVVDVDDTTMAATGTDKKLTVAQRLSFPANAVSLPANPAGTVSLTAVMMGLGSTCAITTNSSGRVLVTMTGQARTATAAVSCTTGGRYGTGTAPVNGAAGTRTTFRPPDPLAPPPPPPAPRPFPPHSPPSPTPPPPL